VHALDGVFVWLTRIGTYGSVWIAIGLVLLALRRRPAILLAILAVPLADGVSDLIKVAVGRARPHLDPLVHLPASASFPSGHATTSFAGATGYSRLEQRLAPAFVLLAAAIAFSRLYVGVHWPTDVIAGAALGAAVATSLPTLARLLRRSPAGRRRG
jgi:undecaprenyl-diphosphatase